MDAPRHCPMLFWQDVGDGRGQRPPAAAHVFHHGVLVAPPHYRYNADSQSKLTLLENLVMPVHPYAKGLKSLGNEVYAWLQPDGSWGWNNAGLVVDSGQAMLIDTLWDLRLTREMLKAMADANPAARQIGQVVNTHANGDHCWGNQLVSGAEIIASRRGAAEMQEFTPGTMNKLMGLSRAVTKLGSAGQLLGRGLAAVGLAGPAGLLQAAPFVSEIFGPFHFEEVTLTPPTRTFDGELTVTVGQKEVVLMEVGPAHTEGDVLAYIPADKVIFSGDILFIEGHPVMWAGPVGNWIRACERILALDVETIVPGHGPITDKAGVAALRDYLAFLEKEARARFNAGISVDDASLELARLLVSSPYKHWNDAERVAVNVDTLYREFRGQSTRTDVMVLFARMARLRKQMQTQPQA